MNRKQFDEAALASILDGQFQKNDRCRKRAYICSPLHSEDPNQQLANMRQARQYMLYAYREMGVFARAPHAYLPMLLCDAVAAERAAALRFGLELLELSDVLLVCGTTLSGGMKGEIRHAVKLGLPITVYDEALYVQVRKLVTQAGGDKRLVTLDLQHEALASAPSAKETAESA